MNFIITAEEKNAIDEWYDSLKPKLLEIQNRNKPQTPLMDGEVYYGAIGGGLTYSFTPTGLGTILTVTESITKEEFNVTAHLGFDGW